VIKDDMGQWNYPEEITENEKKFLEEVSRLKLI